MKYHKKLNQRWSYVEKQHPYRYAVIKNTYNDEETKIKDNCLDGILLSLNTRSRGKSLRVQYRILRRIVNKRMAQAIHKKNGRSGDRLYQHLSTAYTSKCMKALRNIQMPKQ